MDITDSFDVPLDLLEGIPADVDQMTVVDEARVIGRFIWHAIGRSFWRLVFMFSVVFVASLLPALLIIVGLTPSQQTTLRGILIATAVVYLTPVATFVAFNFVVYGGLRDIVERLGFGQKIGAGFIAFIEPSERMSIPLSEFGDRLKGYLTMTKKEAEKETRGFKGFVICVGDWMVFTTVRFALNRIAKDCVVDGDVDLERFATGVAQRVDGVLISYFKALLWDLTRVILALLVLLLFVLLVIVTQLIKLF